MALHERVRDHDYDPLCFGCKAASVSFNLSTEFRAVERRERKLERDLAAYKRLRSEGLQPASIRDAATLEARADHRLDVDAEGTSNPLIKGMSERQKNEYVEAVKTASPLPGAP